MSSYQEIVDQVAKSRELGDDFELREVKRWTVHCVHCGVQLLGEQPQTDKSFYHLKRMVAARECRNMGCVSNGGTERRRPPELRGP